EVLDASGVVGVVGGYLAGRPERGRGGAVELHAEGGGGVQQLGGKVGGLVVIGADHEEAAGLDVHGELGEGGEDGLEGAVVVEVVRLDVGDDGDFGAQVQEGGVVLVGLGDQLGAAAPMPARAEAAYAAA